MFGEIMVREKSTFYCSNIIAYGQNTSENVLVIDFNTLNPALDSLLWYNQNSHQIFRIK